MQRGGRYGEQPVGVLHHDASLHTLTSFFTFFYYTVTCFLGFVMNRLKCKYLSVLYLLYLVSAPGSEVKFVALAAQKLQSLVLLPRKTFILSVRSHFLCDENSVPLHQDLTLLDLQFPGSPGEAPRPAPVVVPEGSISLVQWDFSG